MYLIRTRSLLKDNWSVIRVHGSCLLRRTKERQESSPQLLARKWQRFATFFITRSPAITKDKPVAHSLLPDFSHFLARSKTVMSRMDRMVVQASLCTAASKAFTSCSRFSFQKASSNFSKSCFL